MFFFRKHNPVRFVVLFEGRSGSTMLKGHLQAHPDIQALGEIFDDFPKTWQNQSTWLKKYYLDLKWTTRRDKVIGFKTKLTSIADPIKFKEFVEENEIRVIHLYRSNPVKLAVSVIRAKRLRERWGKSNIKSDNEALAPIEISVEEFRRTLRNRKQLYKRLSDYVETLNTPRIDLFYEQFLEEEQKTLDRVWGFLGVESSMTSSKTKKNTPDDLGLAVSNLAELKAAFPELMPYF